MSDASDHDHGIDHHNSYGPGYTDPYGGIEEPALPGMEADVRPSTQRVGELMAEPPHPVNWNLLTAGEAQAEWLELDRWVTWLRRAYGLPTSVIPPLWHRHPELVWELSALHLHWVCSYDPQALGTAPSNWHREFAETRHRLRDWVAACGTRTDTDRPTPRATWPGESATDPGEPRVITNRDADFSRFVIEDVARRRRAEDAFYAQVAELAEQDLAAQDE